MAQASTNRGNTGRIAGDADGATMVFGMRLLLAVSALLTLYISPASVGPHSQLTWIVFGAYALHSAVLLGAAHRRRNPFWHGKVVYWLDLCWYAMMIYFSGGSSSFFFPFFFFAILTASFQWGFDDGARITLGSTAALTAAVLLADQHIALAQLLLRTTFVLALGYMIAYWGGLGLAQQRRLGLLRDVSRLSNPRFGVDQSIASVLQQTRQFYRASNCFLLKRDSRDEHWVLHSAIEAGEQRRVTTSLLSPAAAAPLLAFGAGQTVLYAKELQRLFALGREACALTPGAPDWSELDPALCAPLADLLDGVSFISTPLPLRKGEGRIYVVSAAQRFHRSDASFLRHLATQVFPVLENIELLDRLASDAAFRERQKIARDLHDSTIQPYIGLRHGLHAIRQSLAAEHPVSAELDKLLDMTGQVIGDMRSFARTVRSGAGHTESELLVALRRQSAQVQQFYGIAIAIEADAGLAVSDRLAAEVFQIVNEGMSNIRKHTRARSGRVVLGNADGQLRIRIENDHPDGAPEPFLPASLAERTVALGGAIEIDRTARCTAVRIAIPV